MRAWGGEGQSRKTKREGVGEESKGTDKIRAQENETVSEGREGEFEEQEKRRTR